MKKPDSKEQAKQILENHYKECNACSPTTPMGNFCNKGQKLLGQYLNFGKEII